MVNSYKIVKNKSKKKTIKNLIVSYKKNNKKIA